jgi:hypothetical protein
MLSEPEITLMVVANLAPQLEIAADQIAAAYAESSDVNFAELTTDLQAGAVVDCDHCERILASAGKSMDDLRSHLGGRSLAIRDGGWYAEPASESGVLAEIKRLVGLA